MEGCWNKYSVNVKVNNTAPIDYMYYGPYVRASQHSLNENIYTNLYIFLIIMTYSMNIKNKKGCLNVWHFFYFHMEMLSPHLLSGSCKYMGAIECSIYALLLPA